MLPAPGPESQCASIATCALLDLRHGIGSCVCSKEHGRYTYTTWAPGPSVPAFPTCTVCLVVGDTAIARSSSHRSAPSRALGRGIPKCTDCQTSGPETGPDQVAIGGHHAQVVPLGRVPYTPLMMSVFMHACQRATEQAPERASSFVQVSISWYARV